MKHNAKHVLMSLVCFFVAKVTKKYAKISIFDYVMFVRLNVYKHFAGWFLQHLYVVPSSHKLGKRNLMFVSSHGMVY